MFFPHGIIISEVEGTGRNKSTPFDKNRKVNVPHGT